MPTTWFNYLIGPVHQCLNILHTSYLQMCEDYHQYSLVHPDNPIPFHVFVFLTTIRTIPAFCERYPYLCFRILTLPIYELQLNNGEHQARLQEQNDTPVKYQCIPVESFAFYGPHLNWCPHSIYSQSIKAACALRKRASSFSQAITSPQDPDINTFSPKSEVEIIFISLYGQNSKSYEMSPDPLALYDIPIDHQKSMNLHLSTEGIGDILPTAGGNDPLVGGSTPSEKKEKKGLFGQVKTFLHKLDQKSAGPRQLTTGITFKVFSALVSNQKAVCSNFQCQFKTIIAMMDLAGPKKPSKTDQGKAGTGYPPTTRPGSPGSPTFDHDDGLDQLDDEGGVGPGGDPKRFSGQYPTGKSTPGASVAVDSSNSSESTLLSTGTQTKLTNPFLQFLYRTKAANTYISDELLGHGQRVFKYLDLTYLLSLFQEQNISATTLSSHYLLALDQQVVRQQALLSGVDEPRTPLHSASPVPSISQLLRKATSLLTSSALSNDATGQAVSVQGHVLQRVINSLLLACIGYKFPSFPRQSGYKRPNTPKHRSPLSSMSINSTTNTSISSPPTPSSSSRPKSASSQSSSDGSGSGSPRPRSGSLQKQSASSGISPLLPPIVLFVAQNIVSYGVPFSLKRSGDSGKPVSVGSGGAAGTAPTAGKISSKQRSASISGTGGGSGAAGSSVGSTSHPSVAATSGQSPDTGMTFLDAYNYNTTINPLTILALQCRLFQHQLIVEIYYDFIRLSQLCLVRTTPTPSSSYIPTPPALTTTPDLIDIFTQQPAALPGKKSQRSTFPTITPSELENSPISLLFLSYKHAYSHYPTSVIAPPSYPTAITELRKHSLSFAPCLFSSTPPDEDYLIASRDKLGLSSTDFIVYVCAAVDRSRFVSPGKVVLTTQSLTFSSLLKTLTIPFSHIVQLQLSPPTGVATLIRPSPVLCITYATEVAKDTAISFRKTKHTEIDDSLRLLEREGYWQHKQIWLDTGDLPLLWFILVELWSLYRIQRTLQSSTLDIEKQCSMFLGAAALNAMKLYHIREKEVYSRVLLLELENKKRLRGMALTFEQRQSELNNYPQANKSTYDKVKESRIRAQTGAQASTGAQGGAGGAAAAGASHELGFRTVMMNMKLPSFAAVIGELYTLNQNTPSTLASCDAADKSLQVNYFPTLSGSSKSTKDTTALTGEDSQSKPASTATVTTTTTTTTAATAVSSAPPDGRRATQLQMINTIIAPLLTPASLQTLYRPHVQHLQVSTSETSFEPMFPSVHGSSSAPAASTAAASSSSTTTSRFGQSLQRSHLVDYTFPIPDGVFPPGMHYASVCRLHQAIPNFQAIRKELSLLMTRDVMNRIVWATTYSKTCSSKSGLLSLPRISCMRPIYVKVSQRQHENVFIYPRSTAAAGLFPTAASQFTVGSAQVNSTTTTTTTTTPMSPSRVNPDMDISSISSSSIRDNTQQEASAVSPSKSSKQERSKQSSSSTSTSAAPPNLVSPTSLPGHESTDHVNIFSHIKGVPGAEGFIQSQSIMRTPYHVFLVTPGLVDERATEYLCYHAAKEYQTYRTRMEDVATQHYNSQNARFNVYNAAGALSLPTADGGDHLDEQMASTSPTTTTTTVQTATPATAAGSKSSQPTTSVDGTGTGSDSTARDKSQSSSTSGGTSRLRAQAAAASAGTNVPAVVSKGYTQAILAPVSPLHRWNLTNYEYGSLVNNFVYFQYYLFELYNYHIVAGSQGVEQNLAILRIIKQRMRRRSLILRQLRRDRRSVSFSTSLDQPGISSSTNALYSSEDGTPIEIGDILQDDGSDDDDGDDDDDDWLEDYCDDLTSFDDVDPGDDEDSSSSEDAADALDARRSISVDDQPDPISGYGTSDEVAIRRANPSKISRFKHGFRVTERQKMKLEEQQYKERLKKQQAQDKILLIQIDAALRHFYLQNQHQPSYQYELFTPLTSQDRPSSSLSPSVPSSAILTGYPTTSPVQPLRSLIVNTPPLSVLIPSLPSYIYHHIKPMIASLSAPNAVSAAAALVSAGSSFYGTLTGHGSSSNPSAAATDSVSDTSSASGLQELQQHLYLYPRSIGDGAAAVFDITSKQKNSKFTIRKGIDTISLTKRLIDPLLILLKFFDALRSWIHPTTSFFVLLGLLSFCYFDMLMFFPCLITFITTVFLFLARRQPWLLELYIAPWSEGDVPYLPLSSIFPELLSSTEIAAGAGHHDLGSPTYKKFTSLGRHATHKFQQGIGLLLDKARSRFRVDQHKELFAGGDNTSKALGVWGRWKLQRLQRKKQQRDHQLGLSSSSYISDSNAYTHFVHSSQRWSREENELFFSLSSHQRYLLIDIDRLQPRQRARYVYFALRGCDYWGNALPRGFSHSHTNSTGDGESDTEDDTYDHDDHLSHHQHHVNDQQQQYQQANKATTTTTATLGDDHRSISAHQQLHPNENNDVTEIFRSPSSRDAGLSSSKSKSGGFMDKLSTAQQVRNRAKSATSKSPQGSQRYTKPSRVIPTLSANSPIYVDSSLINSVAGSPSSMEDSMQLTPSPSGVMISVYDDRCQTKSKVKKSKPPRRRLSNGDDLYGTEDYNNDAIISPSYSHDSGEHENDDDDHDQDGQASLSPNDDNIIRKGSSYKDGRLQNTDDILPTLSPPSSQSIDRMHEPVLTEPSLAVSFSTLERQIDQLSQIDDISSILSSKSALPDLTSAFCEDHFATQQSGDDDHSTTTTTASTQQQQQSSAVVPIQTGIVQRDYSKTSTPNHTKFLAQFQPKYHTLAEMRTIRTQKKFSVSLIDNILNIQKTISSVVDKATTIQRGVDTANHHLMKVQGLIRWHTPAITMKLCLLLCVVTFALFFIPFRFLFALILLDIFTKKITNKDGTLTRLLQDVEVTQNANTYSFVTDDDIEKVFYEIEQERNGH